MRECRFCERPVAAGRRRYCSEEHRLEGNRVDSLERMTKLKATKSGRARVNAQRRLFDVRHPEYRHQRYEKYEKPLYEPVPVVKRKCAECGKAFLTKLAAQFCSTACGRKAWLRANPEKAVAWNKRSFASRRNDPVRWEKVKEKARERYKRLRADPVRWARHLALQRKRRKHA